MFNNNVILETENDENNYQILNIVKPQHFGHLQDNILYYISGYIAKKIQNNIDCYTCVMNLIKIERDHCYSHYTFSKFLDLVIMVDYLNLLLVYIKLQELLNIKYKYKLTT